MKRTIFFTFLSFLLLVSCKQETYFNITTSVQPSNGGSIIITPPSGPVVEGTSVSFNASPKGDYVFTGWSGSLSGTENPKTVTVTSDLNVIANFELKTYPLTVSIEGEGVVNERVISTKTEFGSGTVVELAATPSIGWSFDHWEGDLSGSDNPARITVSGARSVKAVFTKNKYSYNIKIIGPGVVDEYLIPKTKADFEYGTEILLKAIPSQGAVFKGWLGDVSGTETEQTVNIEQALDITAVFNWNIRSLPLPDLKQPSESFQKLFLGINPTTSISGHSVLFLDYNRDGVLDLVVTETDGSQNSRMPVRFYLGNTDGGFTPDLDNQGRIPGQIAPRKQVYGDFNNDGFPDILLIGHGWDHEPWPGEYPIVLMSQNGPTYTDVRYTNYVSFYHGGATGDFDNDGDLDAFLVDSGGGLSVMMINDGLGHFSFRTDLINQDLMASMYNAELYDVDTDGFLDLLVGAHDHEGPFPSWEEPFVYRNMPIIFWGNGETYNHSDYTRLPQTNKWGYGLVTDFDFYDLDNDGIEEIILLRTGDGRADKSIPSYQGWDFQIIKRNGRSFQDATLTYFDGTPYELNDSWLVWLDFDKVADHTYLVASQDIIHPYFELSDGKLKRVEREDNLCLYSDGIGSYETHLDLAFQDNPYSGSSCMHISEWPSNIWAIDYPVWLDYSELEKNGYSLEFAIKNEDPNLELAFAFETRLQTDPWYFPSYSYTYSAREHRHDGTWEVIRVPLSEMRLDEEWEGGYYWNTIKSILLFGGEYHGKEFYLDEIRIRRILDTQQP